MFKRIQIKGFRTCRDVTLSGLGFVTGFVGQNGSGKTNILQAIRLLAELATGGDLAGSLLSPTLPLSFSADVVVGAEVYRYSLSIRFGPSTTAKARPRHRPLVLKETMALLADGKPQATVFEREGQELRYGSHGDVLALGPLTPGLRAIQALLPNEVPLIQQVEALFAALQNTRYYPLDEPNEAQKAELGSVVREADYQRWKEDFARARQLDDAVLMKLLHLSIDNGPLFATLCSLLDHRGLNLIAAIKRVELGFDLADPAATAANRPWAHGILFYPGELLGGGVEHRLYHELSLGTRRVLRMLVSLLVDGSDTLLLEHPEEGIHPGLLRKLLGLLRAHTNPAQLLFSSHSPTALNTLRPEEIRLVEIQGGATSVRALSANEVERAVAFMSDEGTLAEFVTGLGE